MQRPTRSLWKRSSSSCFFSIFTLTILWIALPLMCLAQETRTAEIEQQRDQKASKVKYDEPEKFEKKLIWIEDNKVLDRLTAGYHGWNLRLGGLVQGSGFALGPEYHLRNDFTGGTDFVLGAQLSTKLYQKYYTGFNLPNLAKKHISFQTLAVHRNYSQIDYFGPGPRSSKDNRTDYRLEDTSVDGSLGFKPVRQLEFGGSAGYLWTNIGPGTSDQFPSTDTVFPPIVTPGIDRQTNFLRYGPY